MDRRRFLAILPPIALVPLISAPSLGSLMSAPMTQPTPDSDPIVKLVKPDAEWKRLLTPPEYDVMFRDATERPRSSPLDAEKRAGTFVCAACALPLFESTDKFDSGTGWPSFTAPIAGHIETKRDFKMILPRTEYHCARCEAHQGHVFPDGPPPTFERHCLNSVSLSFTANGEPLPDRLGRGAPEGRPLAA